MDFFAVTSPDILDGTGSALTITGFVTAPQAGATRKFYPLAGTVLTHGATFDIAGNANLTAAAGDAWVMEVKAGATTCRAYAVKEDGTLRGSYGAGSIATNFAAGDGALQANTTGANNTAVGYNALLSNTIGIANTAVGYNALRSNTTGTYNTAFGWGALYANTTATHGTAFGTDALQSNTTGERNTAFGNNGLQNNTIGEHNTACGNNALLSNTTGSYNTSVGKDALYANTIGVENTACGKNALQANTTGSYNSAFGLNALQANTTGAYNTAVGNNALLSNTAYDNCTGVGYNAAITGSSQIQCGNSATTTYVYGTVQNRSDLRDKADVRDTTLGIKFIQSLRPVDYRWDMRDDYKPEAPPSPVLQMPDKTADDYAVLLTAYNKEQSAHKAAVDAWLICVKHENIIRDGSKKRIRFHHGFIAQEIAALNAGFGGVQDHQINGGEAVMSLGYSELIAPMVKAIQEIKAELDAYKVTHP
jgi:hypothetical protein